jgi:photosystem II stability/assembly factor-like uncharacterized protein
VKALSFVCKITIFGIGISLLSGFSQISPNPPHEFAIETIRGKCTNCDLPYSLGKIQFVDLREGWAQGCWISSKGQGAGTSTLLHTTDGGHTWEQLELIKQHVSEDDIPFSFVNSKEGWVAWLDEHDARNSIIRTIDGGNTWDTITSALLEQFMDIQFFNDKLGYAIRSSLDRGIEFAVTKDGGKVWAAEGLPIKYAKQMYFLNAQIGWILGASETKQMRSRTCVSRTLNGGQVWTELKLDKFPSANVQDMFWINENAGWLVMALQDGNGSFFLKTTDGGKTWKETAPASIQGKKNQTGIIRFVSDKCGFAFFSAYVEGPNYMLLSSDGGKNWKSFPIGERVSSCQVFHGELWCTSGFNIMKIESKEK